MLNMKAFCVTLLGILLLNLCTLEALDSTTSAANTTTAAAPEAPSNVAAASTGTTITVTWQGTASHYEVEYRTKDETDFTKSARIEQTETEKTDTITGVIPGTTYVIRVTAYDSESGGSGVSSTPNIEHTFAPSAPSSVSGVSTERNITVTWVYGVSQISDGYIVYCTPAIGSQCSPETGADISGGSVRNATFTDAIYGQAYNFHMEAYITVGGIQLQSDRTITSGDVQIDAGVPTGLTLVDGISTSVTVSWTRPDNSVLQNYQVVYRPTSSVDGCTNGTQDTTDDQTTTLTVSPLTPGCTYSFTVISVTSTGQRSSPSNTVTYTIDAGVPTGLTLVEGTSTSVTVSWTRPENSVLQNYQVVYTSSVGGCNDGTQDTTDDQTTTLTVSPLTPGCTYSFTVISVTSTGQSSPSNTVTYTTAPNAVTNTSVQISVSDPRTLVVTWVYPSDGLYDGVTIYCDASNNGSNCPDSVTVNKPSTSYNFTALTPGETYNFILSVRSGVMFSSNTSTANTTLAPSAVSDLTSTAQTTDSITFQWSTGEGRADGFDVTISPVTPSATIPSLNTPSSSGDVHDITISGLTADTEYTVTVTSKASDGASGFVRGGNRNYTERTLELAPGPVKNLTSTSIKSKEIIISWEAPNPLNSVVAYAIRVLYMGGSCEKVTILNCSTCTPRKSESEYSHWETLLDCGEPATQDIPEVNTSQQFTVELLSPVTNYTIEVTALNTRDRIQYESIDVTTDSAPPGEAPSVTVDGFTYNSTNISWNAVSDEFGNITHYTVSYNTGNENAEDIRVNRTVSDRYELLLINLKPYSEYTISVTASSDKGPGPAGEVTQRTKEYIPGPPATLTLYPGQRNITVSWSEPAEGERNGIIVQYQVTYYRVGAPSESFITFETNNTAAYLDGEMIRPYREYTVEVRAKTGYDIYGDAKSEKVTTQEADPGPVINLTSTSIKSKEIIISWEAPSPLNSVVAYAVRVLNVGGSCEKVTILNCSTCTSRKSESEYSHWWTLLDCGEPATKAIPEVNTSQQFIVESLSPVTDYTINVTALNTRDMIQYESIDVTTVAAPPGEAPNVTLEGFTYNSVNISWDAVSDDLGNITHYTVSYRTDTENAEDIRVNRTYDSDRYELQLINLKPYSEYTISVTASSDKGPGPVGEVIQRTKEYIPGPPATLTPTPGKRYINVSWSEPAEGERNGIIVQYKVTYYRVGAPSESITFETNSTEAYLDEEIIRPYREYTVEVRAKTGYDIYGDAKSDKGTTQEAEPTGAPSFVRKLSSTPTSIVVEWGNIDSELWNGEITSYRIAHNTTDMVNPVDAGPVNSQEFTGLQANAVYRFEVRGCTVAGCAGDSYVRVGYLRTNEAAPITRPIDNSVRAKLLDTDGVKKDSITFHLPSNPEDAGFTSAVTIREIQILVLAQDTGNKNVQNYGTEMSSLTTTWADAQSKGFTGVYAIGDREDSPVNWRFSTRRKRGIVVLSVTVGEDTTCKADGPGYCNGPLKSSTEYCIYLRGFTTGGYADSDCLVLTRTLTDPITIAVPVTVSVVLLVIVCVVATVIYRQRKRKEETTTDPTEYDEVANISDPRPVYENTTPNQDNNNYEMIVSPSDYEQLNHHQQTNDNHTYTTFNQA